MLFTAELDAPGSVRHLWPEKPGFFLRRENGLQCYTFWHFSNPVELFTPDGIIGTKPDACYVCTPNTYQYFISREALVHDWIHFDETDAAKWTNAGLEFNKIYYPIPADFISNIIQKIEAESISRGLCYNEMINSKLSELFITIARVEKKTPLSINDTVIKSFQQLRLKMFENLEESWTIKRMADAVNVSTSYFHAIYKEIYGLSPTQDIINARMSSAQKLLRTTNTPISEIANMLGYSSSYHFTHQFSHFTGMSPSKYRNTPL